MDGNLEIHDNGLRFRPDGPSSKIGKLELTRRESKLTDRPTLQQYQTLVLSAERKGAYSPHSRSPQSANHVGQEEDLGELRTSRSRDKLII